MTRANAEGPFWVDLEDFPLVRMGSPQVAHYDHPSPESFFGCIDKALSRNQPFVLLHDARGVPHADERRRQGFMQLLEARRAEIERLVVAYGAICGSPLERGLITAFMWFIRLPLPLRIFGSEAEAKAWLLSRHGSLSQTGPEALARDSGFYSSERPSTSNASSAKRRNGEVA
jgi:hypothetical protein